jgi:hypothetical protein
MIDDLALRSFTFGEFRRGTEGNVTVDGVVA